MRHLKAGKKFNRSASHRLALMRNLVTSLLRHERIETTDPKAKELRRWADHMIGLGKEGTLDARRRALSVIQDYPVVQKLFDTLAPRFKERAGGYTRIVKLGWRHGDQAPVSVIELIPGESEAKTKASSRTKKEAKAPSKKAAAEKQPRPRRAAKKAAA
jgi:large subunit ribosomal protein L17